jgi:predicted acyltransferase
MYIPVPDIGAGVFEPGRNFAVYFDKIIFPGNHWLDPNGVSILTAIASVLFGVLAGDYLQKKNEIGDRIVQLFVWGNILLLLSFILDSWMPINKRLWTVSYTLFMAGWAQVTIAMLLWMIDKKGWKWWTKPFLVFGMNALVIYVAAGVIGRSLHFVKIHNASGLQKTLTDFIYETMYSPFFEEKMATLLYNISILALLYVFGWILWKMKIFVRA